MRLDDWVIGRADLGETTATIAVRKKPYQKDTLIFKLRREQGVFAADVEHPGDPNAESVPSSAEAGDLVHLERLLTVLAPTTLEVARRSPNQHELSLKREGDSGRREEFYLKRDNLLEGLQPLPREGRAVFAPLGLDSWVPATTMRPPEAAPGRVEELLSIDIEEG